jgi:hypothetical protein
LGGGSIAAKIIGKKIAMAMNNSPHNSASTPCTSIKIPSTRTCPTSPRSRPPAGNPVGFLPPKAFVGFGEA